MKVLIVGHDVFGAIVQHAAAGIKAELVESIEDAPEVEAPDFQPVFNKAIFVVEASDNPEPVPISEHQANRQSTKTRITDRRPLSLLPVSTIRRAARFSLFEFFEVAFS